MIKQYDKYKDSGVEWLGRIPFQWDSVKLKFIGDSIIGLTYTPDDVVDDEFDGILVLRSSNIQEGKISFSNNVYVKSEIPEKLILKYGDILLCSRNGSRELIGKNILISETDSVMTFGAFMTVFRTEYSSFIYYFFNSQIFKALSSLFLSSTINQLTLGVLNNMVIALPPKEEQIKIAQYLDHQTDTIDLLIQQKEKLIELLKEKKQAKINESVTKGLNPKTRTKYSGFDWLGEVPENWKVLNFRYVIDVLTDFTANGSFADLAKNVTYLDSGYSRLIRLTDLRENLNNEGLYVSEDSHNYLSKSALYGDEVLLANVGAYAGLAWKVPHLTSPSTLGPNMFLLKFYKTVSNEFAYYSLLSSYLSDQLKNKAISSAQPKLNKDDVRSCIFVLPPINEQIEIVNYISEVLAKYEALVCQVTLQIEKLKEFRQSIISEAVTGKIDVREWQPNNQQLA